MLAIVQQTNMELLDSTKIMVSCVFDCFMPEMQEEVVKAVKEKEKKIAGNASKHQKKAGRSEKEEDGKEEESRYVEMEPIKKIVSEADNQDPVQEKIKDEIEGSSIVDNQIGLLTPTKGG